MFTVDVLIDVFIVGLVSSWFVVKAPLSFSADNHVAAGDDDVAGNDVTADDVAADDVTADDVATDDVGVVGVMHRHRPSSLKS